MSVALVLPSAAMCVLTACAHLPPRTAEQRAVDDELAAKVEAALLADPRIYARHIDVRVDRGKVDLAGLVWSNRDFLIAKIDAASVPGVMTVSTQLELVRGGLSGAGR